MKREDKTLKNLCWFQVVETRGNITKGKVHHWQVTLKVGFALQGRTQPELLHRIDAYWRVATYLSVGQIFLCANPPLRRPLTLTDVKRMLLGHWGSTPGQNFMTMKKRAIERWENEGGEIPSSTRGAGSGDGVERKPKPPVRLPFSGYTP